MDLRDRIKELANKRGLSIPNLEVALGFGNGTIVRWNKSTPTADKLSKVADYLNVSVDYLLGRENNDSINMDLDIRRIQRVRNSMPEKDREKMMNILKASFEDYFGDDFIDEDSD